MNKYRARATMVDGIRFASKREAHRYMDLRLLQKAGEIAHLELQVRFGLSVNGFLICHYVADFQYVERGQKVIEDAKGVRTPVYRIKANLMEALHGITIRET